MNITKFYSANFTSASTGASIPQVQLLNSKNDTNNIDINKNNTDLLLIIRKQEPNKSGNSSALSTTDNYDKLMSNKQTTPDISMTSRSRTIAHENKLLIKPESKEISKNSTVNVTNGPFILSLPSINKNISSLSSSPQLQSKSHSKTNNEKSRHHKN